MFGTLIHRWLRIPYTLNVRYNQRPKKARVTILFIHGIGTSGDQWNEVVTKLPSNVNVITIDLLGFGNSPMPKWAVYSAKTQARSVLATIFKLHITTPIIIVGHSLGALVGIEMARRYPLLIKSLILCSPPLYRNDTSRFPRSETILRSLYRAARDHPDRFMQIAELAHKYKLVQGTFNLTHENIDSYMAALGAMIINQTSLEDAYSIKIPTLIIRGSLDPIVVPQNFAKLAKANPNISVKTILAGHNIYGRFIPTVTEVINNQLRKPRKDAKVSN